MNRKAADMCALASCSTPETNTLPALRITRFRTLKEVLSMKTLILATLSLCFALSTVAFTQDAPKQAPQKDQAAGAQLTSITGTVKADGDKLTFVTDTDQKAWNVENPESLKGHQGHHVQVRAHVYTDKDSIHIAEVKMLTASENKKDDMK